MKKELQLELVKKYPNLFRDYGGDMKQTCMAWGFECGDGWYDIIDRIGQKLVELKVENKVIVEQVKEKFGGLRFYYTSIGLRNSWFDKYFWPKNEIIRKIYFTKFFRAINDYLEIIRKRIFGLTLYEKVQEMIYEAEEESYRVCELCGTRENVTTNEYGWLITLCDSCRDKRNNEKV